MSWADSWTPSDNSFSSSIKLLVVYALQPTVTQVWLLLWGVICLI